MNKPITAAIGSFLGWALATLAVGHVKHGELPWGIAIAGGLGMGIAMYGIAKWKQDKTE